MDIASFDGFFPCIFFDQVGKGLLFFLIFFGLCFVNAVALHWILIGEYIIFKNGASLGVLDSNSKAPPSFLAVPRMEY